MRSNLKRENNQSHKGKAQDSFGSGINGNNQGSQSQINKVAIRSMHVNVREIKYFFKSRN